MTLAALQAAIATHKDLCQQLEAVRTAVTAAKGTVATDAVTSAAAFLKAAFLSAAQADADTAPTGAQALKTTVKALAATAPTASFPTKYASARSMANADVVKMTTMASGTINVAWITTSTAALTQAVAVAKANSTTTPPAPSAPPSKP